MIHRHKAVGGRGVLMAYFSRFSNRLKKLRRFEMGCKRMLAECFLTPPPDPEIISHACPFYKFIPIEKLEFFRYRKAA